MRFPSGESVAHPHELTRSIGAAVAQIFRLASLEIACIDSGYPSPDPFRRADHLKASIEFAGKIGCPIVKAIEPALPAGQNGADSGIVLGNWLSPLADFAADRSVTIALDHTRSHRSAGDLWGVLDRLNHPSLGCVLDICALAAAGESPQVAIPLLDSKIVYVQICDKKNLADAKECCDPGDGVVPLKSAIERLSGIGYSGWVNFDQSALCLDDAGMSERLGKTILKLREWTEVVHRAKPKAKAAK